jgi:hypothetical protein
VPYTKEGETTQEHFPELYKYQIVRRGDNCILENLTKDGRKQTFEHLVFHGGVGATLEMRVFSERSLMGELAQAGFWQVKVYKDPDFEHGIYWNPDWSLGSFPVTARK